MLYSLLMLGHEEVVLHCEGGETLERVAQKGGGCPMPRSVQGQVG